MKQNVLIVGATSAIAQSVAKIYAKNKSTIFLVARNEQHLEIIIEDLIVRGAEKIDTFLWDASEPIERQKILIAAAKQFLGSIDIALIAYGSLPNQTECKTNVEKTLNEINLNGISVVTLLTELSNKMLPQGSGTIAVISSVAGDRGRQSNYVYGAAKSLLSTFLQGLRARLYKKNIHVLTIKPGFVDTPMTSHLKKNFLFATPDKVAADIVLAVEKKKDILYTPWFWYWIMMLIKCLPEKLSKRLNF